MEGLKSKGWADSREQGDEKRGAGQQGRKNRVRGLESSMGRRAIKLGRPTKIEGDVHCRTGWRGQTGLSGWVKTRGIRKRERGKEEGRCKCQTQPRGEREEVAGLLLQQMGGNHLHASRVDDKADVVDGDGRLCDVGCQDNLGGG